MNTGSCAFLAAAMSAIVNAAMVVADRAFGAAIGYAGQERETEGLQGTAARNVFDASRPDQPGPARLHQPSGPCGGPRGTP